METWGKQMYQEVRGSVYFVSGEIQHLWHRDFENRYYEERKATLNKYNFNPNRDLKLNSDGCWEWATDKPDLQREVRLYFEERKEDKERIAPVLPL